MNAKELKSLSRGDLLEMLIMQTDRVERMEIELQEAKRRAEARDIIIERSGTLAEAAMHINEVWKAADKAAAQYLSNVLRMYDEQEQKYAQLELDCAQRSKERMAESDQQTESLLAEANQKAETTLTEAESQAQSILEEATLRARELEEETTAKCRALEEETRAKCDELLEQAKAEVDAYRDSVYEQLAQYCAAQESLKALLQAKG